MIADWMGVSLCICRQMADHVQWPWLEESLFHTSCYVSVESEELFLELHLVCLISFPTGQLVQGLMLSFRFRGAE